MSLSLRFAAGSHKGMIREGNEDSGYAGPRLLAVADGMGGQAAGEVASSEVLSTIVELDEDLPGADVRDALRTAVERANDRLRAMIDEDSQLEGMGTTLTALLWSGSGGLGLVHIGDSRAYLLRDGGLVQITQDHTWVQRLVDEGRITEEEAGHHPQRSLLMRALDGRGQVEPDLSIREARAGDRYLVCSDGLSGVVSRETMEDTLLTLPDPRDAVQELIQLALRGGGPDNITCIVADVVDTSEQPSDIPQVVGAVADDRHDTATLPTTPASRARELTSGEYEGEALVAEPTSRRKPKSGWRRTLPLWGTVVVLAAGLGGAYWWTQRQYYVTDDHNHIAIYRGVDTSFLGLHLSKPVKQYPEVTMDLIGPRYRAAVQAPMDASGLGDAQHKVDLLKTQAGVCQQVLDWNAAHPVPDPAVRPPAAGPAGGSDNADTATTSSSPSVAASTTVESGSDGSVDDERGQANGGPGAVAVDELAAPARTTFPSATHAPDAHATDPAHKAGTSVTTPPSAPTASGTGQPHANTPAAPPDTSRLDLGEQNKLIPQCDIQPVGSS